MLFTITREQYQNYIDVADTFRTYIIEKFPRLCEIVETFNGYFGASNVDIYGNTFEQKSLLLTLLERYDEFSDEISPTVFLETQFEPCSTSRQGIFTNLAIYVHWPSVTVTNEQGQSVVVTDLYAKVPISPQGVLAGRFTLTRATYPYDQYISGYMHSHVSGINSDPSVFMRPCLGSGPLNRTQDTLSSSIADTALWNLFCVELDRYVHVESIAGVPYRYLSKIGTTGVMRPISLNWSMIRLIPPILRDSDLKNLFTSFFKYVLMRKKLRFAFSEGKYVQAYTTTEWILELSAAFLRYYALMKSMNKTEVTLNTLFSKEMLIEVKINNDGLYVVNSNNGLNSNYMYFTGLHVLYFKGEDILTNVSASSSIAENTYYVLNPGLAQTFLNQCLNYLNIYEHEKNKNVINEESEVISSDNNGSCGPHRGKNAFSEYPLGEKRIAINI